ncbi:uncharacterized protein LOC117341507 [Pecten maximus]|uniref:uncharacterized protein LOC117341507 n=1 Tax=Pecten maximus TaxID=6579 RepID=UPI00145919BB|nr:uncharacterized protein LOC117341507 [Pecten maximus]
MYQHFHKRWCNSKTHGSHQRQEMTQRAVQRDNREPDSVEESKTHYQELDPSEIQHHSPYASLSEGDIDASLGHERDNYETLQESSSKQVYDELKIDDGSKQYANT